MAGGFAKDGAVQDQIDATVEDAVNGRSAAGVRAQRAGCCGANRFLPK